MLRSIIASVFTLSILSGCTSYTLNEPDRTQFYGVCVMSGRTVTTCECIETETVKGSGLRSVKTDEEVAKMTGVLQKIIDEKRCDPEEEPAAREPALPEEASI